MEDQCNQHALINCLSRYLQTIQLRDVGFDGTWTGSTNSSNWFTSIVQGLYNNDNQQSSSNSIINEMRNNNLVSYLSEPAWYAFILALTELMMTVLFQHCLLSNRFSEWGALFFQQEIVEMMRYLQSFLPDSNHLLQTQHHGLCAQLKLACDLLIIDKPIHVLHYELQEELLNEQQVKEVLLRRRDFKADAIMALKLK